jgi:two-component system, cell cycle response regulator CpdR
MVGFGEVGSSGERAQRFWPSTIAGNRLLSMGPGDGGARNPFSDRSRSIRATGFTRYLPGIRLMGRRAKRGGGVCSPTEAGWKMAKIILAEDDNDMRRFLVKALQNAGFDVISFDNGLSAYQRLREEPFELLLTDIVMPEMDGIELARRASELDPDIKIMFITGFAAVALNADSAAPKHAKVLSKPVHLRDLVNEVQKLLAA